MSSQAQPRDQLAQPTTSERHDDWLALYGTYLKQSGHHPDTTQAYGSALEHFLRWRQTQPTGQTVLLSAAIVRTFLDEHLPICTCPGRVLHALRTLRAALNQFLLMNGQPRLSRPKVPVAAAIADSIREFDHYLQDVCALADRTRRTRSRLVPQFLSEVFGR